MGVSLIFCAGSSILAGLLFGLLPALRASSTDVHIGAQGRRHHGQRERCCAALLVIGELALAMVLLAGAGEMMKSFVRISAPEQGYDERHLSPGVSSFIDVRYRERPRLIAPSGAWSEELDRLPGAMSAALERVDFLAGFGRSDRSIRRRGSVEHPGGRVAAVLPCASTPGYFTTIKLPIVAGRAFTDADRDGAERVVMINRRMAEMLWPGPPRSVGTSSSVRRIPCRGSPSSASSATCGAGTARRSTPQLRLRPVAQQAPGESATLLVRAPSESRFDLTHCGAAAVRSIPT